eukprot:1146916-Pelagomonas_calceolata.AAC.6
MQLLRWEVKLPWLGVPYVAVANTVQPKGGLRMAECMHDSTSGKAFAYPAPTPPLGSASLLVTPWKQHHVVRTRSCMVLDNMHMP